jgi:hypothetical protein
MAGSRRKIQPDGVNENADPIVLRRDDRSSTHDGSADWHHHLDL